MYYVRVRNLYAWWQAMRQNSRKNVDQLLLSFSNLKFEKWFFLFVLQVIPNTAFIIFLFSKHHIFWFYNSWRKKRKGYYPIWVFQEGWSVCLDRCAFWVSFLIARLLYEGDWFAYTRFLDERVIHRPKTSGRNRKFNYGDVPSRSLYRLHHR